MADLKCFRGVLLATSALFGFAFPVSANAESTCSQAADGSVTCQDGAEVSATGVLTPATVASGVGLQATSASALSGSLTGDISTSTDNRAAVFLQAADAIDYSQDGDVSTAATGAVGMFARSEISARVDIGDITTSALNSHGITISSGGIDEFDEPFGTLTLTCGDVATTGAGSDGVILNSGSVMASCGNITAVGAGSRGVAVSGSGTTSWGNIVSDSTGLSISGRATVGDVTTYGNDGTGIRLSNEDGGASVDCSSVTTFGDDATGIDSFAYQGGNGVDCGDIHTYGDRSFGGGFIDTGFAVGDVTTAGFGSGGVAASGILFVSGSTGDISTAGVSAPGLRVESYDVDLSIGDITTAGDNSPGMVLVASGDVTVSTGDVTTLGKASPGIDLGGGSSTTLSCGNVATSGDDSNGVRVVAGEFLGSVTVRCGNISATGAGSRGLNVGASGNVDIRVGNVVSDGPGISAGTSEGSFSLTAGDVTTRADDAFGIAVGISDGFGSLTCGNIMTFGANSAGLQTSASDGSLAVTCGNVRTEGDNSTGVSHGTDGLLTLADVTTLGNNSAGLVLGSDFGVRANVANVSTSGDHSAALRVFADSSAIVAGNISTVGDDSVGVSVQGGYGGFDIGLGHVTTTGDNSHGIDVSFYALSTFDSDMRLQVDGVSVSGAGADAIRFDLSNSDVAPHITIGGDVTSEQGAAIRVDVGEALQAGSGEFDFNVPEGLTVSGRTGGLLVDAPGTVLDVAGAVEASIGPAVQVVGGPGRLTVEPTGSVMGFVVFGDGDDRLSNLGRFNAVGASYFGGGSDLLANSGVLFVTGDSAFNDLERLENSGLIDMRNGSASDSLTLNGDYAGTGGASVLIDVSRSLNSADHLVVNGDVSGNTILGLNWVNSNEPINANGVLVVDGVTDASLFTLQGAQDSGLFLVALRARDGGLYLVAAVDPAATDFVVLGRLPADAWYQSFDAIRASIAGRGSLLPRLGLWAQAYGAADRSGKSGEGNLLGVETPFSTRLDTDRVGAQLGFDGSVAGVVVGGTGGFERAKSDAGAASKANVSGFNLGAYASIGGGIGPYATATVKRDWLDVSFRNPAFHSPELDGHSTGADLELGWRLPLAAVSLDVNAGLSMVRSNIEGFAVDGLHFSTHSGTSTRARAGGRLTFNGPLRPFAEARAFHEFGDASTLEVLSGDMDSRLHAEGRGTWGRVEAGIGGGEKRPLLSAWADFGDHKGWGVRAGFRF